MKKRFRILPGILVVLCVFNMLHPVAAQNKLARVSVVGNKFIANGQDLVFRGLNVADPDKLATDGHWNERHFKEIKSWGANIVRFPVHPAAWRKRGEKDYLELLDKGVAMAEAQNLYVIIDWHSIGNLRTEKN